MISVFAAPSVVTPPGGWVSTILSPAVFAENVNVILVVAESTGISAVRTVPSRFPVAQKIIAMFFLVDSRTK